MKKVIVYALIFISLIGMLSYKYARSYWYPIYSRFTERQTLSDIMTEYGADAENRLKPYFKKKNVEYPPEKVSFIAFKDSNLLQLWASANGKTKLIRSYEIKAASGVMGPKLREGDRQVPEGIYKIVGLNPNSSYHLSMKLNYPNRFDLLHAKKEGRTEPGSNIFIHGKSLSIGCLAMGDKTIEELFTLVYAVGLGNVEVVIAPTDPKESKLVPLVGSAVWVHELYQKIEKRINAIRKI